MKKIYEEYTSDKLHQYDVGVVVTHQNRFQSDQPILYEFLCSGVTSASSKITFFVKENYDEQTGTKSSSIVIRQVEDCISPGPLSNIHLSPNELVKSKKKTVKEFLNDRPQEDATYCLGYKKIKNGIIKREFIYEKKKLSCTVQCYKYPNLTVFFRNLNLFGKAFLCEKALYVAYAQIWARGLMEMDPVYSSDKEKIDERVYSLCRAAQMKSSEYMVSKMDKVTVHFHYVTTKMFLQRDRGQYFGDNKELGDKWIDLLNSKCEFLF